MSKEVRDKVLSELQALMDEYLKTHTIEEFRALVAETSTSDLSK